MSFVRRIQRKGSLLYLNIPRHLREDMELLSGEYLLIHQINERQFVVSKINDDLPVIIHEELN